MTLPALHSLCDSSPATRVVPVVQRRIQLGVELRGMRLVYDYDEHERTITVGIVPVRRAKALMIDTMRNKEASWLLHSNFLPHTGDVVNTEINRLNLTRSIDQFQAVAEALAVFFDHPALPEPVHRRALLAMHEELAAAYIS